MGKKITAKMVMRELNKALHDEDIEYDEELIEKYLMQPIKDLPIRFSISKRALSLFDEFVNPDRDEDSEVGSFNWVIINAIVQASYFAKGSRKSL